MQEIFSFQQKGLDAKGNVRGTFRFQGIRPKFIEKFKMAGVHLPQEIFDPNRGSSLGERHGAICDRFWDIHCNRPDHQLATYGVRPHAHQPRA